MGVCVRIAPMVAFGCLALPAVAHADPSRSKLGVDPRQSGLDAAFVQPAPRSDLDRFRAHLGVDLASWLRQTPWPRAGAGPVGPRDDAAFPGYHRLGIGFGLGHGFGDVVVAGLHVEYEVTWDVQRTPWLPDRSPRSLGLSAMPYLEFMMMRRGPVRPFAMVRGGIGGSIVTTDGSSPLEHQAGRTLSLLHPSVGLGLGAHAFLSPEVSLDGCITLDHRWEFARYPGATPDPAAVAMGQESITTRGRHDAFGRRINAALSLSVSRWF